METAQIRDLCLAASAASGGGELARALALTDQALNLARAGRALGAAVVAVPHHAEGLALTADGWVRAALGDVDLARARFRDALVIGRALKADDPEHALAILKHAANFLRETALPQDEDEASRLENEGLALLGEALGTDHLRYFQWRQAIEAAGLARIK